MKLAKFLSATPLLLCASVFAQSATLTPANFEALGTASVAETLETLRKDSTRIFAEHSGWLVGEKRIEGGSELWSFVPESHEAYPSAIQRLITDGEEGLQITMNIQCDASQQACDDLNTLFSVMNENLIGVSKSAPPIRNPDSLVEDKVKPSDN